MAFNRRLAAVMVLGIGVAACAGPSSRSWEDISNAPPVPAVPIRDNKIVPGHRIGPVAIGMTSAELYRAMGEPTKTVRAGKVTRYEYPDVHAVVLDSIQKVVTLHAISRQYATPEGVSVGDSDLAAHAAYTSAQWKPDNFGGSTFCDPRGMKLSTINGKVIYIVVWSAGC